MRREILTVALVAVCLTAPVVAASADGRLWNPPANLVKPIPANENWADSEARLSREIEEARKTGSPVDQLKAIQNLAYPYWKHGDYVKAVTLYGNALEIARSVPDLRNGELVICLNNLGLLYREMGRYELSRKMHTEALRIAEMPGKGGEDLRTDTYFSFGLLGISSGKYADAEMWLDKARKSIESGRAGTMDYARLMDAHAKLYIILGKYAKADSASQRGWTVADKLLPADSQERLTFLDTRASVLLALHRFTEAEKTWLKAVEMAEDHGLSQCPDMITVLSHLGELNLSVNDPVKAQDYLERSITLTQKLLGRTSVEAAAMTGELGLAYTRIGNYERAEEKFSAALAVLDTPQSGRPLELAALLTYHGEFLRDQNRWNDAYENFKRAAELREKVLGEHPMVATAYQLCAAACRKLKRKDEAKSYEAKAQEIVEGFPQTQLAANTVDVKMLKPNRASGFVSAQH